LSALSGRTITLKCVIRPSSPTVIMSTPLILMPVDLAFELTTAPVSLRHPPKGKARPAQHLHRTGQILERDFAPLPRRMHNRAFEHRIGMQRIPQHGAVLIFTWSYHRSRAGIVIGLLLSVMEGAALKRRAYLPRAG
jgi:hypothetical protein